MTRFLAESLEALDPAFRLRLRQLETAHGKPTSDIRLTTEISHNVRAKLFQLGLDSQNTTSQELYEALKVRARHDDILVVRRFQTLAATHISVEADPMAGLVYALQKTDIPKNCFALKQSVLKSMLKNSLPRKTMKQLGYRSSESMLKHENPILIMAAACLCEAPSWHRNFSDNYKRLRSSDFETRSIAILYPTNKQWRRLASGSATKHRHNIVSFYELGAIVTMPLPKEAPAGSVTACLLLALQAYNEIRSNSLYLQLCQVRSDFGLLVKKVAAREPLLLAELMDQAIPWQLIQRTLAEREDGIPEHWSAAHVNFDSLVWRPISAWLDIIEPRLEFWKNNEHLGRVVNGQAVSLNFLDSILNLCNQMPFQNRLMHHYQQSLWHELLIRYLQPQAVEIALQKLLQPQQFIVQPVTI